MDLPDSITELIRYLDNESDRFWRRFHIFIALQIGATIGFARVLELLKSRDAGARTAAVRIMLLLMTVFSFVGAVAITRGCDLQLALGQAINDTYDRYADESIGPNIYREVSRHGRFRNNAGTTTVSLFTWLCAVFWPMSWFWIRSHADPLDALAAAHRSIAAKIERRRLIVAAVVAAVLFLLLFRVGIPSSIATVIAQVIFATIVLIGFACVSIHVVCEVPFAARLLLLSTLSEKNAEDRPPPARQGDDQS